jgi:hypothetical protein
VKSHAVKSEFRSRRGRPRGITDDTRKRITLAAAFAVDGYLAKEMAPYVLGDQPKSAEANIRRFLHDHRRRINAEKRKLTPATARKIVNDIRSGRQTSQRSVSGQVCGRGPPYELSLKTQRRQRSSAAACWLRQSRVTVLTLAGRGEAKEP